MADMTGTRVIPESFEGQDATTKEWVTIEVPPGTLFPPVVPSNYNRLRTTFPITDPGKIYNRVLNYMGRQILQPPVVGNGVGPQTNFPKTGGNPPYPELEMWEQ